MAENACVLSTSYPIGPMMLKSLCILPSLFVLLGGPADLRAAGQGQGTKTTEESSDLSSAFDELVEMMGSAEWTPVDWARASYLAVRLSRFGSPGVPRIRARFLSAASAEEAILGGIYVAVFGETADHVSVRKDLETNPRKRVWLREMLGNREAINASLREGAKWRAAIRLIPALDGCRSLCLLCIQSSDALVRRAGLYWGYWIADDAYWKAVGKTAAEDGDSLTRALAQHLQRQRQAGR